MMFFMVLLSVYTLKVLSPSNFSVFPLHNLSFQLSFPDHLNRLLLLTVIFTIAEGIDAQSMFLTKNN